MVEKQGILIYINDEIKSEAKFMSHNIIDKEIKNRAYINTVGAETLKQYLMQENFKFDNIHNIHSIARILEAFDISDVFVENMYIDVRVVFDENQIFIPKSHKEFGINPDIYAVLKLDNNFECLEFLGFFSPDIINTSNQNDKYYFVDKSDLSDPSSIVTFIKNNSKTEIKEISEEDMLKGREFSIALADHDISNDDLKEYINLLISSDILRDSVLEYDNFETLSHRAAPYLNASNIPSADEDNIDEEELPVQVYEEDDSENNQEMSSEKDLEDDSNQDEDFTENEDIEDNIDLSENEDELSIDADELQLEDLDADTDMDIDADLDAEIDLDIDNLSSNEDVSDDNIAEKLVETGAGIGGAAVIAAAAGTAAAVGAEAAASDEAIKLAGMSGSLVENIVENNLSDQYANVNNIDSDMVSPAVEMPDNISDGVVLPDDMFDEMDNNMVEESANIEDLEQVEPDDSYIDIMAQERTVNIEDLPITEGEIMEDFDHATNIEDLPITEGETITEDFDHATNIEDLPPAESDDILEEFDNATNIEDLSIVENENNFEENSENLIDNLEDVNDVVANSDFNDDLNVEDTTTQPDNLFEDEPDMSFENMSQDEVLNEIENKQIFPEAYEDESNEPSEVFDLTDEEAWDKMEEINNDFENSGVNVDIVEEEPPLENNLTEDDNSYSEQIVSMDDFDEISEETPAEEGLMSFEQLQMPRENPVQVEENTQSISDEEFSPGEIPIDINEPESNEQGDIEHLENIYNDSGNLNDNEVLNNSARFSRNNQKKTSFNPALAVVGGLLTLVIVGVIGMSAMKMLKPAQDSQTVNAPQTPDIPTSDQENNSQTGNSANNMVITMDNNSVPVQNLNNQQEKKHAQLPATSFLEISRLSWEIPDYVAYNADFKNYFQSAGKSLKAGLSSDLLLATDVVYSKQVRVSVTFDKNGSFRDSRIVMSSGSSQVDKIVLQSVNQTLRVLKAPNSLGNDESTTVILKIYL